jgi:hypothetical protein
MEFIHIHYPIPSSPSLSVKFRVILWLVSIIPFDFKYSS